MQHDNTTPRIIVRRHARDRAAECCIPPKTLRHCIRSMSPDLAAFAGILDSKGKVALMSRDAPSPVIRHTGDAIEVISVLRPGQRVIRRDTLEVWVESGLARRPGAPARQLRSRPRQRDGVHSYRGGHRLGTPELLARRPRPGIGDER
jgi:hypothetical protein